ncbi:probable enoyl-CoA hydratase 2, mitochondrial isoform X2 [Phoenix dactylifera]|uniref:Probable enoyl-CoA hydratase 2, mitochondrial isoform X2 n=1 Tax=Phoenix dactylifera TaxID=42345 RepID=A0A8B7CGJ9_PHODC|nr:probable enoyl-CoA hydratase 2, mitochondrial isoform X2 [Phoenix dactylifera]
MRQFQTLIWRCLRGPSLGSATCSSPRLLRLALAGRSLHAAGPAAGAAVAALPHPHCTLFRRSLILQTVPEPVKVERLSDSDSGIIELTLDRGEAKNAIGKEMLKGLQNALEVINGDSSANVVMVCSSVPRVFCAGADLKERRHMSSSEVQLFVNSLRSTFSSLEALSIPAIAVIEGVALGGGLELVLSCDLRICGEDAMFGMPETGLAIIPGAGGTQRLPRVVGRSVAKELIFTGRKIDGREAFSLGVVNYCVPAGKAYIKALQIARDINQKGPLAIRMAKQAINQGMEVDMPSALDVEEKCYEKLLNTQDRLEGLAAFAEKRKPRYLGK